MEYIGNFKIPKHKPTQPRITPSPIQSPTQTRSMPKSQTSQETISNVCLESRELSIAKNQLKRHSSIENIKHNGINLQHLSNDKTEEGPHRYLSQLSFRPPIANEPTHNPLDNKYQCRCSQTAK
jgi:hypothetical protein